MATAQGLCECGCGEPTRIAKKNHKQAKQVKGQPLRFIQGHSSRGTNHPLYRPLEERFWEKVNRDGPLPSAEAVREHPEIEGTPCWEWTGHCCSGGYGGIRYEGTMVSAHRTAWFLETGKWPEPCGLHKCDNKKCVRFFHLFEGTLSVNTQDMYKKGRGNAVLTAQQVLDIRTMLADGSSQRQTATKYKVSQQMVSAINTGRIWNAA